MAGFDWQDNLLKMRSHTQHSFMDSIFKNVHTTLCLPEQMRTTEDKWEQ
jgi:hypothetical protein